MSWFYEGWCTKSHSKGYAEGMAKADSIAALRLIELLWISIDFNSFQDNHVLVPFETKFKPDLDLFFASPVVISLSTGVRHVISLQVPSNTPGRYFWAPKIEETLNRKSVVGSAIYRWYHSKRLLTKIIMFNQLCSGVAGSEMEQKTLVAVFENFG